MLPASLSLSLFLLQGNCPSNDCDSCPCGTSSNYVDIAAACARFSGWDQNCCQCIINHESNGTSLLSLMHTKPVGHIVSRVAFAFAFVLLCPCFVPTPST
jgi:hypothetical protein